MLTKCEDKTTLLPGMAADKRERNITYLLKLSNDNLLLPFRFEAGLYNLNQKKTDFHWGWDSPLSHIRGTFTGHWLSAVAKIYGNTGNGDSYQRGNANMLKAKADYIVDEIKHCQTENGGRWAFPIPEKYLHWIKNGKKVWAPQYVCHKVMMGLLDMYLYTGNETALDVVKGCADWFYDFTSDINRETMSDMMDLEETGGIMELWAELYGATGDEKHLTLMRRYERPSLFDQIADGVDVLTNMHANTTVPEIHGAARAYEVTGEERYRKIVESYWELAVEKRGRFVTGGQTNGEIWTPIDRQAARLSDRNQEHCVVYNMMRLSQYLFKWTGETKYADYYEQNLYNGIFAQGYWHDDWGFLSNEDSPPKTGHVAYYLPLQPGASKAWGSETEHFWCCHCTLVQANAIFHEHIYYENSGKTPEILVAQYLPSELDIEIDSDNVSIVQTEDPQTGETLRINEIDRQITERPKNLTMQFKIKGGGKSFTMKFRLPWWLSDEAIILINGEKTTYEKCDGYAVVTRVWGDDTLKLTLPKKLSIWPLPDREDMVAFIDGPIALAGLCAEERTIYGDIARPETFMAANDERRWTTWQPYYKTMNQPVNFRFVPIYEIGYEAYTVYFPVKER